ncbi:hypothetical protein G6F46_010350 [Rhizopus delemar]|uniref:Splicing factor 3A subunit 1 n=2 Tax=Rhizopus TaxID=4842 RepID=A0A9P6YWD9_9FUNG|nr:hypothetical protein G6F54_002192 [Rhizopus delemar]KAG1537308.1 hypothetical protein G6F51_010446 [Rhizopus arrhizus]KAG1509615.1 hypothetical protein G6F53_007310 [Rhizopus delemar]KAG1544996.1 hypothetical protein G6F49_010928 [Rhizopus delemar]KAG1565224.1 hypothetical protein G6F50_010272 [Rhizopus delemar]
MMEVDQVNLNGIPGDSQPITGIIYPPQNVRTMIDKAAAHLATKPPELAKHILENDKEGKFSFLKEGDPYHAYYLFKFNESKEGKAPQMSEQMGEQTVHMHEEQKVDLAPKKPEEFLFSAPLPAMSAQDLDIIKLTAQFAARNGLGFIGQLMKRESRNYQFDFLHSNHSLFPYFTQLIEQYTKVLKPSNDILDRLHTNQADKYHILDRVKERVEYVAWQEAEKKKKSDEDEKERIAYASIDWHDFVVVETVEFTDADEHADLPPPMSLAELESMSLAQRRLAAMPEPTKEETVSAEEMKVDMDMDDVDMEASDDEMTEQPPAPASVIVPKIPEVSGPIKIRTDYKPKLMGATANKATVPMQTCPRCGETIPVSEMDEHMRIELLDPKWKEQKMAMEAKHKDSNLLQHGTDVAKNLKNFSGLRPDIFDADESETLRKFKQQEEEAKKKDKIIWDGHTATMTLANQRAQKSSIEEQIAQMHRGIKAPTDTIGPQIPGQAYPPAYPQPPMYYPNRTLVNQVPGMYNPGMPGMPMPQPPVGPPPMPMTPAVRKADELGPGAEKKPRTEEPEWPLTDPNAITLTIQTPSLPDKPEWNLTGAPISITGLLPNTLISTLKDRIASQLGMPAGKQKLSTMGAGTVLNNSKTLAFYGIMNGAALVLESLLGHAYDVMKVDATTLKNEPWEESCSLLVIPGGRDTPYCEDLKNAANDKIRQYVKQGGSYLGLCAGAYYASHEIEFEKNTAMEITGSRPLGFFPGLCRGTVYPGFVYNSEKGARSVSVTYGQETIKIYYNGGGYFVDAEKVGQVICRYQDTSEAAGVLCRVGQGSALLFGVHPEYDIRLVDLSDHPEKEQILQELTESLPQTRKLLSDSLVKLGLKVEVDSSSGVPALTPIYLSAVKKELVTAIKAKMLQEANSDFILEDSNDQFLITSLETYLENDITASLKELSVDKPFLKILYPDVETKDEGEPVFPNKSHTPYFNLAKYYGSLLERRKLEWGGGAWYRIGNAMLYSEVITSTQTVLDK